MDYMHDGERALFTDVCREPGDHLFPSDPGWAAVAASLINQGLLTKTSTGHLAPTPAGQRIYESRLNKST